MSKPKMKISIVGLDKNGNVVSKDQTRYSWAISELQDMFNGMTNQLYLGKIQHIAISRED